jgi:hypothetical protein
MLQYEFQDSWILTNYYGCRYRRFYPAARDSDYTPSGAIRFFRAVPPAGSADGGPFQAKRWRRPCPRMFSKIHICFLMENAILSKHITKSSFPFRPEF